MGLAPQFGTLRKYGKQGHHVDTGKRADILMETTATSWIHLQQVLFAKDDLWNADLRRFRSPMVYRGLGQAKHDLLPSLHRLKGDFSSLEQHLFRNFKKYAHRDVVEKDTDWHWLSMAQHHGLPTRLLDWTYSPYVALHFATSNLDHFDKDAAVWAVNFEKAKQTLPDKLREVLAEKDANGFSVDMLGELDISPFDLESQEQEEQLFAMFFEPPSIDDRIVNQFALFSALSRSTATFNDWLAKNEGLWWKLIIPADLKWEVRDKLDQANITERVLFPGLGGLSTWLKRHYSPGPAPR